ncbi:hypothetical protein H0G86_001216 [Trichoderma simmonsii]|uniref:Uncharacterized protein n=1 Tax=Trichoderma simmonsii TaxID=1491479 RepID=A0A8G0L621_9HYPO|nr:hypothetical protein H0G86_001216 [Trichoderma simmonsii]
MLQYVEGQEDTFAPKLVLNTLQRRLHGQPKVDLLAGGAKFLNGILRNRLHGGLRLGDLGIVEDILNKRVERQRNLGDIDVLLKVKQAQLQVVQPLLGNWNTRLRIDISPPGPVGQLLALAVCVKVWHQGMVDLRMEHLPRGECNALLSRGGIKGGRTR